jgi:hypothetical protein
LLPIVLTQLTTVKLWLHLVARAARGPLATGIACSSVADHVRFFVLAIIQRLLLLLLLMRCTDTLISWLVAIKHSLSLVNNLEEVVVSFLALLKNSLFVYQYWQVDPTSIHNENCHGRKGF